MTVSLDSFRDLAAAEHGLVVVTMLRRDGAMVASVVNPGVMPNPGKNSDEDVVAFVTPRREGLTSREERNSSGRTGATTGAGEEFLMGLVLAVLLLAILFGAGGFALHALWIVAVVLLVAWAIGFIARAGEGARWYRW